MSIFVDTNIPISAALNAKGTPYKAFLKAAIKAQADILLTGDKDFLESSIKVPKIMTATEFLNMPCY